MVRGQAATEWGGYGDLQGGGNPETSVDKARAEAQRWKRKSRAVNLGSRGPTGLVMLGRDPVDKPRPFLGAQG